MTSRDLEQFMQSAVALHQAGRLADAEKIYREVLAQKPNHAGAMHLLGVIAAQVGRTDLALDLIRRAIAIDSSVAQFHNDLGNALREAKQLDPAVSAYRQSLALAPNNAMVLNNLGNALCDLGLLDDGIDAYRQAIRIKPDFAGPAANLGKALRDIGQIEESIAVCRKAIRLQPDYAEAHHNLGLSLLTLGDFERGWIEHEWRLRLKNSPLNRRDIPCPRWDGSALNGRTILLHHEQGIGDTIQFVRYAPLVAERGGKVVLQCQPSLVRLVRNMTGIEKVLADNEAPPPCDVHCSLMSLPFVFGTKMETIPATIPYLNADTELVETWKTILPDSKKRKVGIVWAGAAGYSNDRNRSLPLPSLAPLADIEGITFISLQKGEAAAQSAHPPQGMDFINPTEKLTDFGETAALITHLDLVISVDTAVAHLAAAMGKPVWALLPYAADWRWLRGREDSPWYPTLRLFRQKAAGDWADVVDRVTLALQD